MFGFDGRGGELDSDAAGLSFAVSRGQRIAMAQVQQSESPLPSADARKEKPPPCDACSGSEDCGEPTARGNLMPNWITSLEDELNQRLLVALRDGRTLVGFLRTFDQFGNIVLEHCVQRLVAGKAYADIHVGVMIVRGENVLLFGALDDKRPNALEQQPLWRVLEQRDLQVRRASLPRLSRGSHADRHSLAETLCAVVQEKEEALKIKRLREVGDYGYGLELFDE